MATQQILDQRIWDQHNLETDEIFEERILALTDEIMEYAKTTKCFKYWSLKGPDPDHIRLEEFVDGIHFYMSLANTMEITPEEMNGPRSIPVIRGLPLNESLVYHITRALKGVTDLICPNLMDYEAKEILLDSFAHFWAAGIKDGFTARDVESAYYLKNKKNHERQDTGY